MGFRSVVEQFAPYFWTASTLFMLYFGWMAWKAKWSKVRLADHKEGLVAGYLQGLPHNEAVAIKRKGWVLRPQWLMLERQSMERSIPEIIHDETPQPGFVHILGGWCRMEGLSEFNSAITMNDDAGQPVRLLSDPLAEEYLTDITQFKFCKDGMLPPVEFEVRALIMQYFFMNALLTKLGQADRIFNKEELDARYESLFQPANRLTKIIGGSAEERAAFVRVRQEWLTEAGGTKVPGFLRVFDRVLESTKTVTMA